MKYFLVLLCIAQITLGDPIKDAKINALNTAFQNLNGLEVAMANAGQALKDQTDVASLDAVGMIGTLSSGMFADNDQGNLMKSKLGEMGENIGVIVALRESQGIDGESLTVSAMYSMYASAMDALESFAAQVYGDGIQKTRDNPVVQAPALRQLVHEEQEVYNEKMENIMGILDSLKELDRSAFSMGADFDENLVRAMLSKLAASNSEGTAVVQEILNGITLNLGTVDAILSQQEGVSTADLARVGLSGVLFGLIKSLRSY